MSQSEHVQSVAAELVHVNGGPFKPGDYIAPKDLESLVGISPEHRDYALRVLMVREALANLQEGLTSRRPVLRCSRGGIRVLDITEAGEHCNTMSDLGFRKAQHWRNVARVSVDPYIEEMDAAQRGRYEQRRTYIDRMLLALSEVNIKELPDPFDEE